LGEHGYHFGNLDRRLQDRFWCLVSEHTHATDGVVAGLSALPGTARPFASARAMTRFLNHPDIPFAALLEPAQDGIRHAVTASTAAVALVMHDWCMFSFTTHHSKRDRYQRSHDLDRGYELGSVFVVDAANGDPLGPMELRLRTAHAMLSTRGRPTACPPGHIDEVLEVMGEARRWSLDRPLVHVIDREADSVGHYRRWHARAHRFVVRADPGRRAQWQGRSVTLAQIAAALRLEFREAAVDGRPPPVSTPHGVGRVEVVQTGVVLDRPAKTRVRDEQGQSKQVEVPGPPIPLRLVLTRVVDPLGVVRAEWFLLTNVAEDFSAATVAQWYAWRWRIEGYHKLLKSAGQNAEEWQQETGAAFLRRLCVASVACLTVWHLQRDESAVAARLRRVLVRLSGRQMKHRVESTAPALLAGLGKLLAIDDLLNECGLEEVLALARQILPNLFARRKRPPPVKKL
jgi:hypothetical protein